MFPFSFKCELNHITLSRFNSSLHLNSRNYFMRHLCRMPRVTLTKGEAHPVFNRQLDILLRKKNIYPLPFFILNILWVLFFFFRKEYLIEYPLISLFINSHNKYDLIFWVLCILEFFYIDLCSLTSYNYYQEVEMC